MTIALINLGNFTRIRKKTHNLKVIVRDNKSGLDTVTNSRLIMQKDNNYEKFISMDAIFRS